LACVKAVHSYIRRSHAALGAEHRLVILTSSLARFLERRDDDSKNHQDILRKRIGIMQLSNQLMCVVRCTERAAVLLNCIRKGLGSNLAGAPTILTCVSYI
jgi:hypothetical protein